MTCMLTAVHSAAALLATVSVTAGAPPANHTNQYMGHCFDLDGCMGQETEIWFDPYQSERRASPLARLTR